MFIIQSRMHYLLFAILAKSHDICNFSYTRTKKTLKIIKTNKTCVGVFSLRHIPTIPAIHFHRS